MLVKGEFALARYDFYVVERLLVLFALLAGILVAITWVNLTIRGFADFLADSKIISMLLRYAVFVLPESIYRSLALSAYAASVYIAVRLFSDREMTVLFAAGASPARLMVPFVGFGALMMALSSILVHEIMPDSLAAESKLKVSVQTDISQIRIKTGQFLFPLDRVAVFVGGYSDNGDFRNVFVHYARDAENEITHFAETARLAREKGNTFLELNSGNTHFWNRNAGDIRTLAFESVSFNLSELAQDLSAPPQRAKSETTSDLLDRLKSKRRSDRLAAHDFRVEIHFRIANSMSALMFPVLGAAAVIAGYATGRRRGIAIVASLAAIFVLYLLINQMRSEARNGDSVYLMHVPALIALILSAVLIVRASMSRGFPFARARTAE